MTLKVERATRAFTYNGINLKDPDAAMSPEQVRDFYANVYPEITSAAIDGPVASGAVAQYRFVKAVGTKGATSLHTRLAREIAGMAPAPRGHILPADGYAATRTFALACRDLFGGPLASHAERTPCPADLLPMLP